MSKDERNKTNECYTCRHGRELSWSVHLECFNPDPDMVGNPHGIKKGWFNYPKKFDPIWKEKDCANYEEDE